MKNCLIVLAAGIGSRYGYGTPKQFECSFGKQKNKSILHFTLENAKSFFDYFVFVIRKEIQNVLLESFSDFLKKRSYALVYQDIPEGRKKPYGTGHAILLAFSAIPESIEHIGIVNADDYYGSDALKILSSSLTTFDNVMVGYRLRNTLSLSGKSVNRGVCTIDNHRSLKSIKETKIQSVSKDNENSIVSMNLFGFQNTKFVRQCFENCWQNFLSSSNAASNDEFMLPDVIKIILIHRNIKICVTDDHWVGLTHRDDKKYVAAFFDKK